MRFSLDCLQGGESDNIPTFQSIGQHIIHLVIHLPILSLCEYYRLFCPCLQLAKNANRCTKFLTRFFGVFLPNLVQHSG